jgi:hypothetical protein
MSDSDENSEEHPGKQKIWFGKHNGLCFEDLPEDYKYWCIHPDRAGNKWVSLLSCTHICGMFHNDLPFGSTFRLLNCTNSSKNGAQSIKSRQSVVKLCGLVNTKDFVSIRFISGGDT